MQLFPERARTGRKLLVIGLILSLLVHAGGGGAGALLARRLGATVANLLPKPPDEVVATSDAITIEKRTVPRAAHRAASLAQTPRAASRPAQVAALRLPPVPTLQPLPKSLETIEPASAPTFRPTFAPVHHPRAEPHAQPVRTPPATPTPAPTATPTAPARRALSTQRVAALDAQFRRAIVQARSLSDVPPQSRPPATAKRYSVIFTGRQSDLDHVQGLCRSLQSSTRGNRIWHYLQCDYQYPDGYFETVNWPWPFAFSRTADPMDVDGAIFPNQGPPAGFVLPTPFALSRGVCAYFVERCQAVIRAEQQNGGAPP